MVSIRKDLGFTYYFPEPFKLEKRLKDLLESNVPERYYLSDKVLETFLRRNEDNKAKGNGFKFEPTNGNVVASSVLSSAGSRDCDNFIQEDVNTLSINNKRLKETLEVNKLPQKETAYIDAYNKTIKTDISGTISTRENASSCTFISEPQVKQVGNLIEDTDRKFKNPQIGRIYSAEGLAPTLNCCEGGNREPKIVSYSRDKKGKVVDRHLKEVSNTITTFTGSGATTDQYVYEPQEYKPKVEVDSNISPSGHRGGMC